jgi:hypothetical protein
MTLMELTKMIRCEDAPCCGCCEEFTGINGGYDDPPEYDPDMTDQDWLLSMHQEREIGIAMGCDDTAMYDDMQEFEDRYCPEAMDA